MKDEQRLLIALGLSVLFLFVWQALFPPPAPVPQAASAPVTGTTDDATAADQVAGPEPDESFPAGETTPVAARVTQGTTLPEVTIAGDRFEARFAGDVATHWRLLGYRVSLEPGAPLVDLCDGEPEPCVRAGFADRGPPATAEIIDGQQAFRLIWPVGEGELYVRVHAQSLSRARVEFGSRNAPAGTRFEPVVEMAHRYAPDFSQYVFTGLRLRRAGEIESIRGEDLDAQHRWEGAFDWVMWDDKYFARAVLPETPGAELRIQVRNLKDPQDDQRGRAWLTVAAPPRILKEGQDGLFELTVFGGAKEMEQLRRIGRDLRSSIDFGWTAFIARPMLALVHLFYGLTGNYGWAIIILTILIKIALYPLTAKSYRSMQAMAKLKPKMEAIQQKYKEDPQRLQQEMMNLYRSEKVNPLGGCLPMLLQIPIFFALYNVLLVSIELRHAPFVFWINDLAAPDTLTTVALFGFSVPVRILPLIMGATMFLQQKMTPTTVDPAQQKIFMLMPVIFTVLFYGFPSGLVLYWLTNNVMTIIQQWLIARQAAD